MTVRDAFHRDEKFNTRSHTEVWPEASPSFSRKREPSGFRERHWVPALAGTTNQGAMEYDLAQSSAMRPQLAFQFSPASTRIALINSVDSRNPRACNVSTTGRTADNKLCAGHGAECRRFRLLQILNSSRPPLRANHRLREGMGYASLTPREVCFLRLDPARIPPPRVTSSESVELPGHPERGGGYALRQ